MMFLPLPCWDSRDGKDRQEGEGDSPAPFVTIASETYLASSSRPFSPNGGTLSMCWPKE